jgi:pimeloyl-ACP methyl ester carboxylesterase
MAPEVAGHQLAAALAWSLGAAELAALRRAGVPALVAHGRGDLLLPAACAERLHRELTTAAAGETDDESDDDDDNDDDDEGRAVEAPAPPASQDAEGATESFAAATPPRRRLSAARRRNSKLLLLDDAGHMIVFSHVEEISDALVELWIGAEHASNSEPPTVGKNA